MQRRSAAVEMSNANGGPVVRATRSKTVQANSQSKENISKPVKTTKYAKVSGDKDEDETARVAQDDMIDWDEVPGVNVQQRPIRGLPRRARTANANALNGAENEGSSKNVSR